jgi:hypothetical protein
MLPTPDENPGIGNKKFVRMGRSRYSLPFALTGRSVPLWGIEIPLERDMTINSPRSALV